MPEEILETPQPTQTTEPKQTNWPKIILAAVLGLGLLAGAAYAGYYYGTQQVQPVEKPSPVVSQPTPTSKPLFEPTPTPTQPVTDPTAEWKTYRSEEYGFEVKYPQYLVARENRTPAKMTSVNFVREGDQKTFEFSIVKNFLGGWMGMEIKEQAVTVDGVTGKISLWVTCDSSIVDEWEECNKRLDANNYDSAVIRTLFERGSDKWYVFGSSWKKGAKNEDEEIQKIVQILSTFKFLD